MTIGKIYFISLLVVGCFFSLSLGNEQANRVEIEVASENLPTESTHIAKDKLQEYLRTIQSFTKEEYVSGSYQTTIPEEFEEMYCQINNDRAEDVKRNMQWNWSKYVERAMGSDEIRPMSGTAFNYWGGLAMMVVESADTLHILGLEKEFQQASQYIHSSLHFDIDHYTSFFETIIRMVGGLLSGYALSDDPIYLNKAKDLGDRLMKAYTPTEVLNRPNVNLATGAGSVQERRISLAETATNYLEFVYLSSTTGDKTYKKKAEELISHLSGVRKTNGLLPTEYTIETGAGVRGSLSVGNRADSFYEYLLKGWLLTGKKDKRLQSLYQEAVEGIHELLLHHSPTDHIPFISTQGGNDMHHLTCYLPAVLMLGAEEGISRNPERDRQTAYQLTHTCFLMYNTTKSGLADERYMFTNPLDNNTANTCVRNPMYPDMCATGLGKYLLRPEAIESLYVMYSKTRNPIFREWGWKIWTTIREKCRGTYGFGDYNGINENGNVEDRAETWFFSETIKYLYLLFAEEGPTYLEKYVFNTEAHPIPRQK